LPIRVLFLCTGNSARSQMAEAMLRKLGGPRYEVYSAGTSPRPEVNPLAVEEMAAVGIDIRRQRPKDLNRFVGQRFDYVITVCDRARESCPIFPGAEMIHWSFPDPAEVEGDQETRMRAFHEVTVGLDRRLRLFTAVAERRPEGVGS
jgi:arsenate reductase